MPAQGVNADSKLEAAKTAVNRAGRPLNEMMDRPIIQDNVLQYLRNSQPQFDGVLAELRLYAATHKMPIIPHETAVFLDFFIRTINPHSILEVGTAIGYSAGIMALASNDGCKIITIDRFELMLDRAADNFKRMGVENKVTLIRGDASDILPKIAVNNQDNNSEMPKIPQSFDFIFLDCAKSKYIEFLPYCLQILSPNGVIMIDDIFQAGTIFDDESEVTHKRRKIYQGLRELLNTVNDNNGLVSSAIPLGDGILLIKKR